MINTKKIKVVIVNKIFSHYRKPIFDDLNKIINLLLIHSSNKAGVLNVKASYSKKVKRFLYGKKTTQVWLFTLFPIFKYKPDVIIHEFTPSIISLHLTYMYCKVFNKKFIVWGHGYDLSQGENPYDANKAKIRLWYLKKSDAVIVYGQEGKKILKKYIDEKKIFVAQNTLDTNSLEIYRDEYEKAGKEQIKDELKIRFKYNLIYIGRLVFDKHAELLLDINKYVSERIEDIAFHIIGDGEAKETLISKVAEDKLSNVFFYGAIHDEKITSKYLYVSDMMIMPGSLGLSVNHALCFDCPVVSFKQGLTGPFHGPEAEYVVNNKTGYLAKDWNIEDISEWIISSLTDFEKRKRMQTEIRFAVKEIFPKKKMIDGFIDSIIYSLDK